MKDNSIQQLLERYRQGTLGEGEREELNRLTHRDEVMAQAGRRADGIIRRRRSLTFSLAGLLVAGAAAWTLLAPREAAMPLVAEAVVPEPAVVVPEPAVVEQLAPARPQARPKAVRPAAVAVSSSSSAVAVAPVRSARRAAADETVVMCNNQCEADSVISDIWKFLTV